MISDLDTLKKENLIEEETQESLLDQASQVNSNLREKEAECTQVQKTLNAMNTHNGALRSQNDEVEKRLNQEMNLKLN